MKNVRAFKATFIGQTNTRPSHVKLEDLRNRTKVKLSTNNTSYDDTSDIAHEYLNSIGVDVIGRAENGGSGYLLFSDNFEKSIK
jgi:hypothetical protein